MKNRTEMVNVSVGAYVGQSLKNQMDIIKMLVWAVIGFVVGLGNMMIEISPFGAALCAAVPQSRLLPAAFGSAVGSLLLSNISGLGGTHTFTIKYTAAVLLIAAVRMMLASKEETPAALKSLAAVNRPSTAPLLAFMGMLLPSTAMLLAVPFDVYSVVMSFSEAVLAGACAYFLNRSIRAFSLGQGMFTLKRADFISVVLTGAVLMLSLSNITLGRISLGRLLASSAVLVCAVVGGERWGSVAGIICGTAVGMALFPKMQLLGIYALAGLVAGVFSSLGRIACSSSFAVTFALLSMTTMPPPITPLLYETVIVSLGVAILPEGVMNSLKAKVFRQPMDSSSQSVRQLMLERLGDASLALGEIARTTQMVSQKLDKTKAGSLEQVYDDAVDDVCLKCGLKSRCWQQEYTDTINVFNNLTPILRQSGSVCEEDFTYPLSARCTKRDRLASRINTGYQELTAKEGMSRKVARVRSVVTDQFEGLSQLLEGLSQELCGISGYEEQTAVRVRDYLEEINCRYTRIDCYRDGEGRIFLQIDLPPYRVARLDLRRMSEEFSRVCDCEFDLPQKTEVVIPTEAGKEETLTRLNFREKAEFVAEFGTAQHTCEGYRMCGDACQSFTDRRSVAHIILSDGMGSGTAAAVDANMTVSLITKLINAGVGYTAALKIVNSALLVKSGEESLSTLDITAINLYTGQARFYKAGAAPTIIRRGNRTGSVESTSLPAGILTSVEFEESGVKLSDGDIVVMLSDGATTGSIDWIKAVVEHFPQDGDLQALCNDIATTARLRRNDNHDDDITVTACRITKAKSEVE